MTGTMELAGAIKEDMKEEFEDVNAGTAESADAIQFRKMEQACIRKLDLWIAPLMGSFNFIVRIGSLPSREMADMRSWKSRISAAQTSDSLLPKA